MPTRFDPSRWLQQARKQGSLLIQMAIWLLGVLGGFLLPPPVGGSSDEIRVWVRLAQFVITVFIGFLVLAAYFWNQKKHALGWGVASFMALLLATAAFFAYQLLSDAWTTKYLDKKVVIGNSYTPPGRAYREQNPGISNDKLLWDFSGRAESVWTPESVRPRRFILAAIYLVCMPLFTVALMAVIQAIHCISPRGAKRSRTAVPASKER